MPLQVAPLSDRETIDFDTADDAWGGDQQVARATYLADTSVFARLFEVCRSATVAPHRALSLVDALVAAVAETRGPIVLHYDADFELVADSPVKPTNGSSLEALPTDLPKWARSPRVRNVHMPAMMAW